MARPIATDHRLEQALVEALDPDEAVPTDEPRVKEQILGQIATVPQHVAVGVWEHLFERDSAAGLTACSTPLLYIQHGPRSPTGRVCASSAGGCSPARPWGPATSPR